MFSKLINILNDMYPRQILMLAGGVAIAMFAVIFLSLTLWTKSHSEEIDGSEIFKKNVVEMVNVVSAKSDIAPRTMIKENMLQLKEMSADTVPNGAITSFSEVVNTPARTTIYAGDILTEQKVYLDMSQAGFVGSIPADCRAVSISVNDITGVDGFARAGDYVDLLLVEQEKDSATTNILLQNVLLLSINQDMTNNSSINESSENSNTNAISNPSIATFALKPEEALKLISASKLGEIYLMLRPFRPKDMYVDAIDYTAVSSNAVYNDVPVQSPAPVPIQSVQPAYNLPKANVPSPVASLPTPAKPAASSSTFKPIEIIQGDQIVQKTEK